MYSAQITSKRLLAGRTAQLRPLASTSSTSHLSTRSGKRGREPTGRQQYLLQRVVPQRYRQTSSQTPPSSQEKKKPDSEDAGKTSSGNSDKAPKPGAASESSSSTNSQYQVATGFAGGNPFTSGSSVKDAVLTTVAGIGLGMCYARNYNKFKLAPPNSERITLDLRLDCSVLWRCGISRMVQEKRARQGTTFRDKIPSSLTELNHD